MENTDFSHKSDESTTKVNIHHQIHEIINSGVAEIKED